MIIAILAENTTYTRGLRAEHGLSIYVEREGVKALFDTGQSDLFMKNAKKLNIDLSGLEAIFLCHGHYDHTGGLPFLPPHPYRLYAHPDVFLRRYSKKGTERARRIGIPFTKEELKHGLFEATLSREGVAFKDFRLTGEIKRRVEFEKPAEHFFLDEKGTLPDPILDDQALYFPTEKGLCVLLGCCHSGMLNTLTHIMKQTGSSGFHWIIGGTHLKGADEERIEKTARKLKELPFQKISPLHCSGITASAIFHRVLGERFVPLYCGDMIHV